MILALCLGAGAARAQTEPAQAQPGAAQAIPAQALSGQPAAAPAGDSANGGLTQRGVPAEATAENGVLARERALASGRRIAWERYLAELGQSGPSLSDQQIENLVSSIVIEQERTAPTRYTGRITVNFNASRVQRTLGGGGGAPPIAGAAGQAASGPASTWVEAVAVYASLGEWVELQRRLKAAPPVASVSLQAIAVDAARLRLGLRLPPEEAAAQLAPLGLTLAPATGAAAWRLLLGGG
ncbi:hypothetical protein JYK14_23615 [Siccirubricoccus sp. KC 17139]|uniref:DUF2066 domain-containing protein n=1 Tax=Siccirubricoccus soli TaxID=2899147 RepID=A0ABT1DD32_9PROT|nr:hypothetical protein [Siccirubricoccus soli]MCO6419125.1 hypothetical protein [Siccirubricoccus soli]MCP2685260.1 hypothetical protein [Siccirubricoccus soli]